MADYFIERWDVEQVNVEVYGAQQCLRKCGECNEGISHHWMEHCPDPDDEEDAKHPGYAVHGALAFYICKHCEAYAIEIEPDDDDDAYDEGFDDDEERNEPTGSCDNCGVDVYDSHELCDSCEWAAEQ